MADLCVCVCACACVLVVRQSSNRSAAEWGHVWLQPLILPDAFGMMRLSAPGNPLNVFIQAACICHSHTHAHRRSASLVLKYFWLAEVVSSRSLFYFVSNFRVWGSCLALPSSPSFCSINPQLEQQLREDVSFLLSPILKQSSCFISSTATFAVPRVSLWRDERCWAMMQWAATSRHCVMLLALPGFLEFPLFLMRVTFCATHNESRWGGAEGSPIYQPSPPLLKTFATILGHTLPWGSWSSHWGYFWRWCVFGVCGGCFPLFWWLALAGLSLAVAVDQLGVM